MASASWSVVATGLTDPKGIAAHPGGYLLVAEPAQDRIAFWAGEGWKSFRKPAWGPTRLSLDAAGALWVVERSSRTLSRSLAHGSRVIVIGLDEEQREAIPSRVAGRSDGTAFVIMSRSAGDLRLLHVDREGRLADLNPPITYPWALCLSPDETRVLVADQTGSGIFQADADRGPGRGMWHQIAGPVLSEGPIIAMAMDRRQRIAVLTAERLVVADEEGKIVAAAPVPLGAADLCWRDDDTVLLTCRASVHAFRV